MAACMANKMTGITPISMLTASYSVTNNSVNAITAAYLVFRINSLVNSTDLIEVTIPSSITAAGILSYIVITNGNVTNYSPTVTYNPNTSVTVVSTTGSSATPGLNV